MTCELINRNNGRKFYLDVTSVDTWKDFKRQFENRYLKWKEREYAIFWSNHRVDNNDNETIPGYIFREGPLYIVAITQRDYYLQLKQRAENKILALYAEIRELESQILTLDGKLSLL